MEDLQENNEIVVSSTQLRKAEGLALGCMTLGRYVNIQSTEQSQSNAATGRTGCEAEPAYAAKPL